MRKVTVYRAAYAINLYSFLFEGPLTDLFEPLPRQIDSHITIINIILVQSIRLSR